MSEPFKPEDMIMVKQKHLFAAYLPAHHQPINGLVLRLIIACADIKNLKAYLLIQRARWLICLPNLKSYQTDILGDSISRHILK